MDQLHKPEPRPWKIFAVIGFVLLLAFSCMTSPGSSTKSKPREGSAECTRAQRAISDKYGTDYDDDDVVRALHEMSEACS